MSCIDKAKNLILLAAAVVGFLLIFDFVAYWVIPERITAFAPDYRPNKKRDASVKRVPAAPPEHAQGFPRYYFRADDVMGFDINKKIRSAFHIFQDTTIEIFSNDVGCFDKHSLEEIKNNKTYDYFAGDSFTWGYADYENKFPTVYERRTSRFTVKCGVIHTGQLHQFEKFIRTVKAIGHYPQRVIIGYVANDPANDHAHPHTTVIDGFLVDTVEMSGKLSLARRDMAELTEGVRKWVDSQSKKTDVNKSSALGSEMKALLKRYSLSANLMRFGGNQLRKVFGSKSGNSFYQIGELVSFGEDYLTSTYTQRNREAIREWAADSKKNSYQLYFLLIPRRQEFGNPEFYSGLKEFLRMNGVSFVDVAEMFEKSPKDVSYFYWAMDGHWNNEGNAYVGEALAKRLK